MAGAPAAIEIQLDGIVNESAKGGQAVLLSHGRRARRIQGAHYQLRGRVWTHQRWSHHREASVGTNSLHGTMYDFRPQRGLQRQEFLCPIHAAKAVVPAKPDGSIGRRGPIIRNKLFVFGDWEGIRNLTGNTITTSVPTAAMRAGNFSSGFKPHLRPGDDHRGCRRQRVQNSLSPAVSYQHRVRSAAVAVESYYPLPTGAGISNNYVSSMPGKTRSDQADLRLDYYLSAPLKVMFRDSVYDYYQLATLPTRGMATSARGPLARGVKMGDLA